MHGPFIGTEALGRRSLTRGQLRWNYRQIYPGVYLAKDQPLTLRTKTVAAWLWSDRQAIVAGRAAAALHGALWIDETVPIDLIDCAPRSPSGIITRNERIEPDEVMHIDGLPVTSPARTALDLGRHQQRLPAVVNLDALARATAFDLGDALAMTTRYAGARGVARARSALAHCDAGAQSPKESWLRLVLMDAGFPKPQTQIHVTDGFTDTYLDMGWEGPKIGLDYEGDHHRQRTTYVHDIGRYELITGQGWVDLRVVAEHSPRFIVERTRQAWRQRGWDPVNFRRNCA